MSKERKRTTDDWQRRFNGLCITFFLTATIAYSIPVQIAQLIVRAWPNVPVIEMPRDVVHAMDQLVPNLVCGIFTIWLAVQYIDRAIEKDRERREDELWRGAKELLAFRAALALRQCLKIFPSLIAHDDSEITYKFGIWNAYLMPDLAPLALRVEPGGLWKEGQDLELLRNYDEKEAVRHLNRTLRKARRIVTELNASLTTMGGVPDPELITAVSRFASKIAEGIEYVGKIGDGVGDELRFIVFNGLSETIPPLARLVEARCTAKMTKEEVEAEHQRILKQSTEADASLEKLREEVHRSFPKSQGVDDPATESANSAVIQRNASPGG